MSEVAISSENHAKPTARDVTAVVCTWNAAENIAACLAALKACGIEEIILVDASSSDDTRVLAEPYVDKIVTDPRKGLAIARNLGVAEATRSYVLNIGPDNVLPIDGVTRMLDYMLEGGYSGVSAATVLVGPGYWTWATDLYKRARFYPGPRAVIGTPTLFPAKLLKDMPYDDKMGFSDDSDLCFRWGQLGHTFAISEVEVQEFGVTTFDAIWVRYRMYGRSDQEYWGKYAPQWPFWRKVQSLLHPLRSELIHPFLRIAGWKRVAALPFLMLITAIRYIFWVKYTFAAARKRG